MAGKPGELGAHLQHMVAKAMPIAQQQHGFLPDFICRDVRAAGQRVRGGHRRHKRLVVQRRNGQIGVWERLGQDGAIDLAQAQLLQQLDGEVLLQHQRHLRRVRNHLAHQVGQQVGADGIDHPQLQRSGQRVFAPLGNLADGVGLLQHSLGLAQHLVTQRSDGDLVGIALENLQLQLFFQLLDGHRQRGLRHMAGLGRAAEVLFAGHGDDVFEFGQGHGGPQGGSSANAPAAKAGGNARRLCTDARAPHLLAHRNGKP